MNMYLDMYFENYSYESFSSLHLLLYYFYKATTETGAAS